MPEPPKEPFGFDAPALPEHDVMERWRFAAEIARVATEAPPDWSVRVGVYGEWGTGKTTVLRYVAEQITAAGHVPVWLNPWHAATPTELWSSFVLAVQEAAEQAGLEVEGVIANRVRKHVGLLARFGAAATSVVSEQLGKLADEAADFVGARGLLSLGKEQAQKLATQASPRRFVVLVDDLDRARPDLVPVVLFSLKEILDVGGFSFVLGFDPVIVEDFLTEHYSTRILGRGFLDKIIDFPRELPEPSSEQLVALAMQERTERCEFIDEAALRRTLPFVVQNPRSVKRFVHSLFLLKRELSRHREGEINWDVLLLIQVLHGKSRRLADLLFSEGRDSTFTRYRAAKLWSKADGRSTDDALGALQSTVRSTDIAEAEVNETMRLLDALDERTGIFTAQEVFSYHSDLLDRPHAVTWKEYDEFASDWAANQTADAITAWTDHHANRRGERPVRVLQELWFATVSRYSEHLRKAADSRVLGTQEKAVEHASRTLVLLRQLAIDRGGFSGAAP